MDNSYQGISGADTRRRFRTEKGNTRERRRLCFRAALALISIVLILGGCNKDDSFKDPGSQATGINVKARFTGVEVAVPTDVLPGSSAASAAMAQPSLKSLVSGGSADSTLIDAFSVTLGGKGLYTSGTAAAPDAEKEVALSTKAGADASSTRAEVTFENVWVFQFDDSDKAMRCENTGSLKANDALEVQLYSGKGYTIGVVANGPADGLSVNNVPDLATFREGLVFKGDVNSDGDIPLGGILEDVLILDNGQVQVGGSLANKPVITLRRILAEVTVALDYQVDGYTFDGIELYRVPAGAGFGVGDDKTDFPSAAEDNFAYIDNSTAGLAPHKTEGTAYTWYVGDNRRGTGTDITTPQDKNDTKAPQYSTYARVKTHYTNDAEAVLYYDIYLGADMRADFNIKGNHIYTYNTRITGAARDQYGLLDVDGRVSGVSPMQISGAAVTPADELPALKDGILRTGGDYTVKLTGKIVEPVSVRAIAEGESHALVQATAPASTGSAVLKVPANEQYDQTRKVHFEYESKKGVWTRIDSGEQAGYGVTVTHTIPAGDIPREGGSYTVTFTGDIPETVTVRARATGMTTVEAQATPQACTVTLTIPSNEGVDAPRTITFEYDWNGQPKTIVERSQAGYGVTATTNLPASIPQAGKTYTVTLTGELPSGVQARSVIGGTAQTPVNVTQSGVAVNIAVAANTTYANRTVVFQYLWNKQWKQVGPNASQAGYSVSGSSTNAPATIPQGGGSYTVTLTGTIPASVKIQAISGSTVLATGTVTKSGTAATLTAIGANSSYSARSVKIQYQWNGAWKDIKTVSQAGYGGVTANVSPNTAIPQAGGTYTVTLTGSLPASVKIQAVSGSTVLKSGTVTKSGTGVELAIPANAAHSSRDVVFQYEWNGKWTDISTLEQSGYSVKAETSAPATIPQSGGTYTVTLTGTMPASVEIQAITGSTVLATGSVTKSGQAASLTKIAANNGYSSRSINIQYQWNGTWKTIGSARTQEGYKVTAATNCTSLTAEGGTYTITLTGSMPASVPVRIFDGKTALASGNATKSGTAVSLKVPSNWTGASRNVQFQYQWNGTWTPIKTVAQASYSVTASTTLTADVPQAGKTYTVTLTGALPSGVQARAVIGGAAQTPVNVTQSGVAVNVAVAANTTYASRTVVFQYYWNGQWKQVGPNASQAGYSLTGKTVSPATTIPQAGGNYTVTLTGTLPASVKIQAVSGSTVLKSGTVTKSGTGVVLAIPVNETGNTRSVAFQYFWNNKWETISSIEQTGYVVNSATTNAPATIPQAGGTYNVTLTGTLPASVEIQAVTGSTVLATGAVTKSGTAANLTAIGANASYSARTVKIQYKWNGAWKDIKSVSQAAYSVTSGVSPTGNIAQSGGTYTVTLSGSMPSSGLKARAVVSGTSTVVGAEAAISGGKAAVKVDANNSYATRTVQFQYQWNGTWTNVSSGSRTQNAYSAIADVSPTTVIPGTGGTVTVTLTGSLPASVNIQAVSDGSVLKSGTVTKSGTGVALAIPAYNAFSSRDVTFQYEWNGKWMDIKTLQQSGWQVIASTDAPTLIPRGGGSYNITINGDFAGSVTVRITTAGTTLDTKAVPSPGSSAKVFVKLNRGNYREIAFEYLAGDTWVTFATRRQDFFSESQLNSYDNRTWVDAVEKSYGYWAAADEDCKDDNGYLGSETQVTQYYKSMNWRREELSWIGYKNEYVRLRNNNDFGEAETATYTGTLRYVCFYDK